MTKSKSIVGICKRHYRMAIFVALCLTIMVCPAFAATSIADVQPKLDSIFSNLDKVYKVIKALCIIGAAMTIASLAYVFFFYAGADTEKLVFDATARAKRVMAACFVLFFLPGIISGAKTTLQQSSLKGWNPDGSSGNHIFGFTPVEVPKYEDSSAGDSNKNNGSNNGSANSVLGEAYDGKGTSGNKPSTDKEKQMKDDNADFYNCWKNGTLPDGKESLKYRSYLKKWDLSYPTISLTGTDKEKEMKKDNPSYYHYWKTNKKPEDLADYSRNPYKEYLAYWGESVS